MQKINEPYKIEVDGQKELNAWLNVRSLAFGKLFLLVIFTLILGLAVPIDSWLHDAKFKMVLLFIFIVFVYQILQILHLASATKKVNISLVDGRFVLNVDGNKSIEVSSFKSLNVLIKPLNRYTNEFIIDLHWEGGFARLGRPVNNEQSKKTLQQIEAFTGLKAEYKAFERERRQYGYPYTAKPDNDSKR